MPKLEQGRIVRVETVDPEGRNPKKRPVVIVTPTEEIKSDGTLVCVAITAEIPDVPSADHVVLPYHRNRHPRTGLKKRCAAMCSWLFQITETDIKK